MIIVCVISLSCLMPCWRERTISLTINCLSSCNRWKRRHTPAIIITLSQLTASLLNLFVLFACCITSKSTAMVMLRWSVPLTTLFAGHAWLSDLPVLCVHTLACNWRQPLYNQQKGENDHRNTCMGPGWYWTHDPAVRPTTNCAMGPVASQILVY